MATIIVIILVLFMLCLICMGMYMLVYITEEPWIREDTEPYEWKKDKKK